MIKLSGKTILALMVMVMTIGHMLRAHADQNDPRLDALFADLQTALSDSAVRQTEAQIWAYWIAFPDDQTVNNIMAMGMGMMESGRLHAAEQVFDRIIARQPNFAEAWNKRATVRFMIGNHSGSAEDIANVLQLEPRHFGALSGLGMIHMQAGNWQSALKSYQAAYAINPYLSNIESLIDELKQRLKGQAL